MIKITIKNPLMFATRLLFLVGLFFIFIDNSLSYLDPDYFWHWRFGQIINQQKSAPVDQVFLWTLEGQTWVDHEWLTNWLIYQLSEIGGYLLITIFFALIPLIAFIAIWQHLKKIWSGQGDYFIMLSFVLFLPGLLPHFGIRIQEFSFLAITLLMIIINQFDKGETKMVWWLIPLFCLWANLHGGYLIGLFIGFFYWLVLISRIILNKIKKSQEKNDYYRIIIFSVSLFLATLATLINPYGFKLYSFLYQYRDTFYMNHIYEWMPLHFYPIDYNKILAITILIAIVIIVWWQNHFKKIVFWRLILLGAFLILAFKSRRHFPLFTAISLVAVWPFIWKELVESAKKINPPQTWSLILKIVILMIVILININYGQLAYQKRNMDPVSSYCIQYPCQAVKYLKEKPHLKNLKMYNSYNYGGFFIGLLPDWRLFIDGRLPQYPFKGHSLLAEDFEFYQKNKTAKKLNEYKINLVVLDIRPQKKQLNWFEEKILGLKLIYNGWLKNPIDDYLRQSTNWQLLWRDHNSAVYQRKKPL